MTTLAFALTRFEQFKAAAALIGVDVMVLADCSPGTPYSLIRKKLTAEQISKVLGGMKHLKALYDQGNLSQVQNNLQIALWEIQGVKWKSVTRKK